MKSKIEWCDYTINPVKGLCPMACSYCYARRMYKRFKWNPELRYDLLWSMDLPPKPSKIFIGSTMELFGDWIKKAWLESIFEGVRLCPQHTFIFLTKQPQNLIKWSPFPDNCWVGTSITNEGDMNNIVCLEDVEASVKFISFEPLQGPVSFKYYTNFVNWLIIGQQTPTSKKTQPKIKWIKEIVEAADKAKVPVFLKDNLKSLLVQEWDGVKYAPLWANGGYGTLRQEFPK